MILKDISFVSPLENILYDEVLLYLALKTGPKEILRLWESPKTFIVLGRAGKMEDDVKIEKVRKDGIPVLTRRSGGGTVVQGKGCLNYSLILSKERRPELQDLHRSYHCLLEPVAQAFTARGIRVFFQPLCDLAVGDDMRKFSGNAQHRAKTFILQHGTVLYDFDLDLIERYLTVPVQEPAYRQGRCHRDFLANIPLSRSAIEEILKSCFGVFRKEDMVAEERQLVHQYIHEYSGLVLFKGAGEKEKAFA